MTIAVVLILFGTRRTNTSLGRLFHGCARCRQQAWISYVRNKKWFTLFFIPVIPLGSTTYAVCGSCGFQQVASNPAAVDQALAAARMQQLGSER